MTDRVQGRTDLDAALAEAVRALSVLDVDAIEGLADFLEREPERVATPRSAAEWTRLRARHWVLGHLLDGTGRRLEMLRRVSSSPEWIESYSGRTRHSVSSQRAMQFARMDSASKREGLRSHTAAGETAQAANGS